MKIPFGQLLACLVVVATACTSAEDRARQESARFVAEAARQPDASWSYLLPYLSRRYALEIDSAALDLPPAYARLADPTANATVSDIRALDSPIDRLLATALHCDRLGLPPEWISTLERTGDHGGYALTHAVLATGWTLENGCVNEIDVGPLRGRQLDQIEILLGTLDVTADDDPRALDIWVEALALLAYAPGTSRAREEWITRLISFQRSDGGFPEHPEGSHSSPHTSAFALWILLDRTATSDAGPRMIPR